MLNCQVGDLAITVEAELTENIGNIVRIVAAGGYREWSDFVQPVFVWRVEALGPECPLRYQIGSESIETAMTGEVPDMFLRPIRPPAAAALEGDSIAPDVELINGPIVLVTK
jgi:hypothetical protein